MEEFQIAMIRVSLLIPMAYPASMDQGDIEFHLNDSSWCAGNIVSRINEFDNLLEKHGKGCFCNRGEFKAEYVRDATPSDLEGIDPQELVR